IRHMGGLRTSMPQTFVLMLIAALALAGIPLTSGFLSKDIILIRAFEWSAAGNGTLLIPVLAVITGWISTFYIFRLIFRVFFGDFRAGMVSVHEAPRLMRLPMVVLAFCSLFFVFSLHPLSAENAAVLSAMPYPAAASAGGFHTLVP